MLKICLVFGNVSLCMLTNVMFMSSFCDPLAVYTIDQAVYTIDQLSLHIVSFCYRRNQVLAVTVSRSRVLVNLPLVRHSVHLLPGWIRKL